MPNSLRLIFSSPSRPSLMAISYTDPSGRERMSARGREAVDDDAGCFPWTRAVRALSVLAVRSYLSVFGAELMPILSGYRGGLAASLDAAVSKEPRWLVELFGTESCGRARARRIFLRTNPDLRRPGPVSLSLNSRLIDPAGIELAWERCAMARSEVPGLLESLVAQDKRASENIADEKSGGVAGQILGAGQRNRHRRPTGMLGPVCPPEPGAQASWEQLSALERMMLFDQESLPAAEPLAQAVARARMVPVGSVVVPFCGVGQKAIALAMAGKSVLGIDPSAERIGMACFNAALAGVSDRVRFLQGDPLGGPFGETDAAVVLWLRAGAPEASTLTASSLGAYHPEGGRLLAAAAARGQPVVIVTPAHVDVPELGREHSVVVIPAASSESGSPMRRTA